MLKKRFPPLADILPVLAFTAVMFYGWSTVVFLWKLPAYLFFLTLGEIAVPFSHQLVINLAETLFVAGLILLVAALLPARVLKDAFVVRGSAIALTWVGAMMLIIHRSVTNRLGPPAYWPLWILAAVLAAIAFAWVASRVRVAGRALAWLGDQLTIFLFILLPLSAVALVVVLVRLLF